YVNYCSKCSYRGIKIQLLIMLYSTCVLFLQYVHFTMEEVLFFYFFKVQPMVWRKTMKTANWQNFIIVHYSIRAMLYKISVIIYALFFGIIHMYMCLSFIGFL
ncbi:hypothetical protein L9F63_007992, partial [Diploptera punctata]